MYYLLRCECGTFQGSIINTSLTNRGICYCRDCQAFAYYLEKADLILDAQGGTDVIQTLPENVSLTAGLDALACMRLTPRGLLRWHTTCCHTPIGNTPATPGLPYIGVVHSCLDREVASYDAVFGPVRACVNARSATGVTRPRNRGVISTVMRVGNWMLQSRLTGRYRQTPFFDITTRKPIRTPTILDEAEHVRLMQLVDHLR